MALNGISKVIEGVQLFRKDKELQFNCRSFLRHFTIDRNHYNLIKDCGGLQFITS